MAKYRVAQPARGKMYRLYGQDLHGSLYDLCSKFIWEGDDLEEARDLIQKKNRALYRRWQRIKVLFWVIGIALFLAFALGIWYIQVWIIVHVIKGLL